jgi:hypothetical protein
MFCAEGGGEERVGCMPGERTHVHTTRARMKGWRGKQGESDLGWRGLNHPWWPGGSLIHPVVIMRTYTISSGYIQSRPPLTPPQHVTSKLAGLQGLATALGRSLSILIFILSLQSASRLNPSPSRASLLPTITSVQLYRIESNLENNLLQLLLK